MTHPDADFTRTAAALVAANDRVPEQRAGDPLSGKWERLDEAPVASAQMIEWYAPETAKVLRESREAESA